MSDPNQKAILRQPSKSENPLGRTIFLGLTFLVAFVSSAASGNSVNPQRPPESTTYGAEISAAFDAALQPLIEKWRVPGASIAVAKNGKIILAKGYGFSDAEKTTPITPEHTFRMGSINKTITAAAILKLLEKNLLKLDDPVVPILVRKNIISADLRDERASKMTIRHLLHHTAGFDRQISGDPFFQPRLRDVARKQNVAPVTCEAIIRDAFSSPLDFSPGTKYAYSNTGYCILGIVIQVIADEPYQSFVNRELLQPSIGKNYLLGRSTTSHPGETHYHMPAGSPKEIAAPGMTAFLGVMAPYGSYSVENMEALGGWVASPTDVLKFFLALDGSRGAPLLSSVSLQMMLEKPSYLPLDNSQTSTHYGLGVEIRQIPKGFNWWHGGSQPGVQTLAVRTAEGYAWVFALNTRPLNASRNGFLLDFDRAMWSAARSVRAWPQEEIIQ